MNQDSFRSLLNSRNTSNNTSASKAYNRGSLLTSTSSQSKSSGSSEAAFKPRKVKKPTDSKYRDRAAERREGVNEYAEVEGILQDFEKRTTGEDKEVIDEQRKYLGGDATHTVLVKGLDFALLEQNRTREESREDLDEDLESAFSGKPAKADATVDIDTPPAGSKKRTRAELLAELQRSRAENTESLVKPLTKQEELEALERAKQAGKFKPIGTSSFAPVEKKKKKKKAALTSEKAKEVQKASDSGDRSRITEEAPKLDATTQPQELPVGDPTPVPAKQAILASSEPTVEDIEDVDPFADIGEYEPGYGDSDTEGEKTRKEPAQSSSVPMKRNWFNDPDPEPEPAPALAPAPIKSPTPPPEEESGPSQSVRLEGLSSSAMPSVSEFLAMDKEEAEREKKRARKEKKKKGGG